MAGSSLSSFRYALIHMSLKFQQVFLPSQYQKNCVFQEGLDTCDVQLLEFAWIYLLFISLIPFLWKTSEVGLAMRSQDTKSTKSRRTSLSGYQTHISHKAPSAAETRTWWGIKLSASSRVCASSKSLAGFIYNDKQLERTVFLRSIQGLSNPWPYTHVNFFLVDDADRISLMDMVSFISGWIRILQTSYSLLSSLIL